MSIPSATSRGSSQSWYADVFGLGGTSAAVTPKHRFSEPTRNRGSNLEWDEPQPSDDDDDDVDSPLLRAPSPSMSNHKDSSFDFGGLYTDDGCNLGGNLCAPTGADAVMDDKESLQKTILHLKDQNSTLLSRNQALEFESSALRQKQLESEFASAEEQQSALQRSVDDSELTVLREELHQLTEILTKERAEFANYKANVANESTSILPYDVNILSERETTIQELRQKCLDYSQQLLESADQFETEKQNWNEQLGGATHENEGLKTELQHLQKSYQASVEELEGRLDEWQQRAITAEQASNPEINVREIQSTIMASQQTMDALKDEHEKSKEHHAMELTRWQASANDWEVTAQSRLQEIEVLQKDLDEMQAQLKEATCEREEANQSVSHMVETVQQLEAKYLKIENDLFEAKLQLEAKNEEMDALKDGHEVQIAEMEESIQRILMEKSALEESQEEQNQMWEERLEAISQEQGEIAGERELRLSEMEQQIEELAREKNHIVEDYELELREIQLRVDSLVQENEQLQQKSRALPQFDEKKEDESYEESNRINALIAEVDRLERALEEEKQSGESFMSNLRAEYQVIKDREVELEAQVEEQKTEFETFTQELQDAITKRDERIEALMSGNAGHGELLALKAENAHLQTKLNESLPMDEARNEDIIINERDEAIASLVTQTQEQEEIIEELQQQLKDLMSKRTSRSIGGGGSSPDVVKRLEEEAKVFAEQVIELDEEMEQLKSVLNERERQASEMSRQLMNFKEKDDPKLSFLVKDLEAEVDELREANKTQLEEIRELRKKVWTTRSNDDEVATLRNQLQRLEVEAADSKRSAERANSSWGETQRILAEERIKLGQVEKTYSEKMETADKMNKERIQSLEKQLADVQAEFDALKMQPSHVSEDECKAIQDELVNLKQTVENLNFELDNSKRTVQELDGMLAEKRANEAAFHEEEKEELLAEIESLSNKLEEARHRISQMSEDETLIGDFKEKLERADDAREESEKNIIAAYERKLSLLTLDKDVTNDKLRKELIDEKEANAEEIAELNEQLKLHQNEVSELREELEEQIEQREARIFELEHTLEAQEQLVENMKSEMDHLQGSMEGNTARRKEEIEELQKELLDMTAAAAKHEREIEALKGELETNKSIHEAEATQLKKKVVELEGVPEKNRNAQDLQMELRVKEVKDRLEKLKWRNSSLKVENINLRERLERAETILKENDQPDRLKSLQAELNSQSRKIKKLETELERAREPPAASRTSVRSRSLSTTRMRQPPRKPAVNQTPPRGNSTIVAPTTPTAASSPSRKGLFTRLRSRSKESSVPRSPETTSKEAS